MNLGTAPELVSAWPPQGGDIYIREQRTVEEGRDPGECQQVGSAPCIVRDPRPSPGRARLWHRQETGQIAEFRMTGTPETWNPAACDPWLPILYPRIGLDT